MIDGKEVITVTLDYDNGLVLPDNKVRSWAEALDRDVTIGSEIMLYALRVLTKQGVNKKTFHLVRGENTGVIHQDRRKHERWWWSKIIDESLSSLIS